MGYNQVTWANVDPADPLGCNLLLPQIGIEGSSSGFSAVPTIAQLNACSGINQVIGYYNRRAQNWNNEFGTSLGVLSYISQPLRIKAAEINTINSAIALLRTAEGFGVYPFDASHIVIGKPALALHVNDMRKALRIAGAWSQQKMNPNTISYVQANNPYKTPITPPPAVESLSSYAYAGKIYGLSHMTRERTTPYYPIPDWYLTGYATGIQMSFQVNSFDQDLEGFTLQLNQQAADNYLQSLLPAFGGYAYQIDPALQLWVKATSKLGGDLASGVTYSGSVTDASMLAKAGIHLSFIITTQEEVAGAGKDPEVYAASAYAFIGDLLLSCDFGT